MPRVRALTEAQRMREEKNAERERDEQAARNFRMQVGALRGATGMTLAQLSDELGISRPSLTAKINNPGSLRKGEERKLAALFRGCGMVYDPTLGGLWGL